MDPSLYPLLILHRTCFIVFFILNLFLWGAGSSAAIPFTTLLALLCLWFGISLPLTFFGAFLGFRKSVCSITTEYHYNDGYISTY